MKEENQISNVFVVAVFATIAFLIVTILYILERISLDIYKPFIFLYLLMIGLLGLRILFVTKVLRLAHQIKFRLVTSIFHQPRIEGEYKGHQWQTHYRSKDTGRFGGILRTYVKLIFSRPMEFDEKMLENVRKDWKGFKIIVVRHYIREDKNYLLMKVSSYIFKKKDIHALMDHLISIYEDSVNKKR